MNRKYFFGIWISSISKTKFDRNITDYHFEGYSERCQCVGASNLCEQKLAVFSRKIFDKIREIGSWIFQKKYNRPIWLAVLLAGRPTIHVTSILTSTLKNFNDIKTTHSRPDDGWTETLVRRLLSHLSLVIGTQQL